MKPIAPVRIGVAVAYECPIFKLVAFQTFFPLRRIFSAYWFPLISAANAEEESANS
jgi:hypothetical protein